MNTKYHFPRLSDQSFLHPTDAMALRLIKKMRGLDLLVKQMNKWGYEKTFRLQSMGDDIRVTAKTCSSIYKKVLLCAKVLNMPVPDTFISQSPTLNALTTGTNSPMIVLNSTLIEMLTEDELLAVIAHEMGHIKCGHVLYHQVANILQYGTDLVGPFKPLLDATLLLSLLEWQRKAEFTADRAALLVLQDVEPVVRVLIKLAGGVHKIAGEIDYQDFVEQAEEYKNMTDGFGGQIQRFYLTMLRSHPVSVIRAAEILTWSKSSDYKNMLSSGVDLNIETAIKFPSLTPTQLQASKNRAKKIILRWKVPTLFQVTGYKIYRSETEKGGFSLLKELNGREKHQMVDDNLEDGKKYFYYIKSLTVYNKKSQASAAVLGQTKVPPPKIEQFSLVDNLVQSVNLQWEIPESAQTLKVSIYRSEGTANKFSLITTLPANTTAFLDKGLKDGTQYHYYIALEQDGLLSRPSTMLPAMTQPLPLSPINIVGSYNGSNIQLKWTAVAEAKKYTIHQKNFFFDDQLGEAVAPSFSLPYPNDKAKKLTLYIKTVDVYDRVSEKSKYVDIDIA